MALDGALLSLIRRELEQNLLDARVDKIFQPTREEIVLQMRSKSFQGKFLLSARANSPRVQITEYPMENPAAPPMFCMLLRKHLGGAVLRRIRQPGLERVLYLDFDGYNELGDNIRYTLIIEIMGRRSNIIFTQQDGRIFDAIRRSDAETAARLILPGAYYKLPEPQDRIDFMVRDTKEVLQWLEERSGQKVHKALSAVLDGASPIVCRELEYLACGGETTVSELNNTARDKLLFQLKKLRHTVEQGGQPTLVSKLDGTPMDFTYFPVRQYGTAALTKNYGSYSGLLDAYYAESAVAERLKRSSSDLLRVLGNNAQRISKKIGLQRSELENCKNREHLREYGELIKSNIHLIKRGAVYCEVENFYDERCGIVRIPLDPTLSPAQNAQKYFKDYRKLQTAEQKLKTLIVEAERELEYIDSVFDALSRAKTERELAEIREELTGQGYMKARSPKREKGGKLPKKPAGVPSYTFQSEDGFTILCGRNNRQNDQLTLRTAAKDDLWFHVKNLPGAHTILVTGGKTPTDRAIEQAAIIAATFSKAADETLVPVDYTYVKRVKKPQGAKPGMVIYEQYKTIYVKPKRT